MTIEKNYRWELLVWLWLAFFFNQADRQVFNVAMPLIKADLGLTDSELGLVGSLFTLTLALCIPVAGIVGDLYNRKKIIVSCLLFWSIATVCTGMVNSLPLLIIFRSVAVGGGEAFYAPAANGLIGTYHQTTRSLAMSIHQTSLYVGVVASGALGGYIAQSYGWKTTLFIFGGAGVVLSFFLLWRLRKPSGIASPSKHTGGRKFVMTAVGAIGREPAAIMLCMAFLTLVIVNVGYTTWMPTFLHEKFGQSIAEAGFSSMFYHHVFAFTGVILGGVVSDRLAKRNRRQRLIIQALGLFCGVPCIYWMGQAENATTTYVALSIFGFCRGLYEANLYATLFDTVEQTYHSTLVGLSAAFAYGVASLVPFLLGYLKPTVGLANGMSSLSLFYLLGGVCVLVTYLFLFRELKFIQKAKPV